MGLAANDACLDYHVGKAERSPSAHESRDSDTQLVQAPPLSSTTSPSSLYGSHGNPGFDSTDTVTSKASTDRAQEMVCADTVTPETSTDRAPSQFCHVGSLPVPTQFGSETISSPFFKTQECNFVNTEVHTVPRCAIFENGVELGSCLRELGIEITILRTVEELKAAATDSYALFFAFIPDSALVTSSPSPPWIPQVPH